MGSCASNWKAISHPTTDYGLVNSQLGAPGNSEVIKTWFEIRLASKNFVSRMPD